MAVNLPEHLLTTITVHDVDIQLLTHQAFQLNCVLREEGLPPKQRNALLGIKSLLVNMLETAGPLDAVRAATPQAAITRITKEDVNRIRDLFMCGKTTTAIAKQLGYRTLAVSRLCRSDTYAGVPYKPTEFAPPKMSDALRAAHAWLADEEKKENDHD